MGWAIASAPPRGGFLTHNLGITRKKPAFTTYIDVVKSFEWSRSWYHHNGSNFQGRLFCQVYGSGTPDHDDLCTKAALIKYREPLMRQYSSDSSIQNQNQKNGRNESGPQRKTFEAYAQVVSGIAILLKPWKRSETKSMVIHE